LVSEIKNFEYNSFKEDIDNYFKDNWEAFVDHLSWPLILKKNSIDFWTFLYLMWYSFLWYQLVISLRRQTKR
jgi:hypothetical protein